MTKILIADDVAALRAHLSSLLRDTLAGPPKIFEAASGLEALEVFRAHRPGMVVMDISMPEMNGITAAQRIWAASPATRILFCSQFDNDAYVRALAKIVPPEAVHGYAIKGASDDKLRHAIRTVFVQGTPYIDPAVACTTDCLIADNSIPNNVQGDILAGVIHGLMDRATAARRALGMHDSQDCPAALSSRLAGRAQLLPLQADVLASCDTHTRAVVEAVQQGLASIEDLVRLEAELATWLNEELSYQKSA
jgi:DNA-binding NarL/FixJ family response regulator